MALRGDTRSLGLADIFQALTLSKREGTLRVTSAGKEIKVYFSNKGIRLLSTGAVRHTRLGRILLEKENFPPEDLETALQIQKTTGKKLGDILVDHGMLTQSEIEDCLRRQIEEEIIEIFLWNNAEFNFEPGLPQEDFFDPAGEGRIFDFSVSRLLVEAARNVDEWSVLLTSTSNSNNKFLYRNGYPVMPDTSPFGIPLSTVSRVPFILNKPMTIEELSTELNADKDNISKLVAYLVKKGRVYEIVEDKPTLKPLKTDEETDSDNNWRKTINSRINRLIQRPELEKISKESYSPSEAAKRFGEFSQALLESGDPESAIDVLKIAVELSPENNELRKKAIQTYVKQWKFAEAAKLVVEGCQLQHAMAS